YAGTAYDGVYLSTDNGNSWTAKNDGLTNKEIMVLKTFKSNIFAGAFRKGLFLSTDRGNTWLEKNNGLSNVSINDISINDTNIFISNGKGIYLSTNNGDKWTLIDTLLQEHKIRALLTFGTNVFAACGDGVHLSTDMGKSWSAISNEFGIQGVFSLWLCGNYLFAGTFANGVFRTDISDLFTSITEQEGTGNSISIFPNPASDFINITVGARHAVSLQPDIDRRVNPTVDGTFGIRIYDIYGELVMTVGQTPPSDQTNQIKGNLTPTLSLKGEGVRMNVSALAPGVYFVQAGGMTAKFVIIR
ncbi:MAG: hypothetical protein QG635_2177, partial [Bacteroidota bacterium]|nr:hypothetical protein [Bacteroidota bacterium]